MDDRAEGPLSDAPEEPGSEVVARAGGRWRGSAGLAGVAALTCATVVIAGHGHGNGGGGVEVVETGFSALHAPYYDVGYGVVIENTTDKVAYHTIACVDVHVVDDQGDGCQPFTIEVLLPGQRVGFGALESLLGGSGEATGISVDIRGPATWEDPEEHPRGAIAASNLNVAYSPENEPVVSFDRESDYEVDTVGNASAYALLRNDDGEIIGASGVALDGPVRPHERVRHSIVFDARLPDIATAEVYVFPSGL